MKLDDENLGLKEYKNILKSAEVILKDNGIKSKIIKEYLPKMNVLINKYLQSMDFYIDFNLDENFKETVRSRFRDEFAYESFSEGQKLRINIAILFAWRDIARLKNSAHTNILVLDEVFDSSLDDEGIADLTKLLRTVTEDHVHVMVISHRGDSMLEKFDRVYQISMRNGFTTMNLT
jgi:DNA repair exonuclease SbcCD ATPase subunit